MTITVTTRMGQTKYGSGSDSLRRTHWNSDADAVEANTAIDDGTTHTTLPAPVDILRGRYVMFSSGAGAYTSLYRATADSGTWVPAMGNTAPAPLTFRPHLAGDQGTTDVAVAFTHPSLAGTYGKLTYDGQAQFARLTAWDPDSTARGTVYAGLTPATATDLTNLGRVHVRTRAAAERALVLQAHDAAAGNLFTARESGGSDVVTVDSAGYLRARALSGFGGGAINAAAAVVVAPTSAAGDGVNTGLLLHGQSGAASKPMLAVLRDLADTAPIAFLDRENVVLGRLPWGTGSAGGNLSASGRQINFRAQGYDADTTLWRLRRTDYSDPGNTGLDETVGSLSRAAGSFRVPLTVSQALGTSAANLTVQRVTDFNGRFLEFQRVTGGTEVISALEADGRMQLGARWIASGTMRDARQSLTHVCTKRYATPGVDGFTVGQSIAAAASYTYTFPVMQSRSASNVDLNIMLESEYTLSFQTGDFGNSSLYRVYVSENGGAFNLIETREFWGVAVTSASRPVGASPTLVTTLGSLAAGATFQVRIQVSNNTVGGSATMYLRMLYLNVKESLVAAYSAP